MQVDFGRPDGEELEDVFTEPNLSVNPVTEMVREGGGWGVAYEKGGELDVRARPPPLSCEGDGEGIIGECGGFVAKGARS